MTEAQALDLVLPILQRACANPLALRVLQQRRLALSEVLFVRLGLDDTGKAAYLIGDPAAPVKYTPSRNAESTLALHSLAATGSLRAADLADEGARRPVEVARKRLQRALDDLYAIHRPLADAIGVLDSEDGVFTYRQRPGSPRIVTTQDLEQTRSMLGRERPGNET